MQRSRRIAGLWFLGLPAGLAFFFYPENTQASGIRVRPGVSREIITRYKNEPVRESNAPGVVVRPEPIEKLEPKFPEEMQDRGQAGRAKVVFIVNPSGVVTHGHAVEATNQYFAVAAERAISYWRFKSGTLDGRPVFFRSVPKVVFHYHD